MSHEEFFIRATRLFPVNHYLYDGTDFASLFKYAPLTGKGPDGLKSVFYGPAHAEKLVAPQIVINCKDTEDWIEIVWGLCDKDGLFVSGQYFKESPTEAEYAEHA